MPEVTYSRNWKGPRPGVSTFSIDTAGDAEVIIIEDKVLQYFFSSTGPLASLFNHKKRPDGPTYLEFLQHNKDSLSKLQFQFCNAMKDYTGNPFQLNLVTEEVTIDQESMQAIVKGAFPARGVTINKLSVTNNEDILTFWVRDCLAAKVKSPPSKLFSFKKKNKATKVKSTEDNSLGLRLTSAAVLAQQSRSDESDLLEPKTEEPNDNEIHNGTSEESPPKNTRRSAALPAGTVSRKMTSIPDPKILKLQNIFGEFVGDKAQQHRLLLITNPSEREELLRRFSWVPADPELTAESRSRSVPFDLLNINFRIICVLPEDFPRALAYPWPFRAIKIFDGIEASAAPMPTYLPELQRITFDVLDIEKDTSFFSTLIRESSPLAITMIHEMRNNFLKKRRALETSCEGLQSSKDHLHSRINEPAPEKPTMQEFKQHNKITSSTSDVKLTCDMDLACRVMRCPAVCINNCEILNKDEEGNFYYQLPGSTVRSRKCANCTCSLSLHKIQPRAASLINKPFSLADTNKTSSNVNKLGVENQKKLEEAEHQARSQELYRVRLNEWSAAIEDRTPKIAEMKSQLADLEVQLESLVSELRIAQDGYTRWDSALDNWNDKNSPD